MPPSRKTYAKSIVFTLALFILIGAGAATAVTHFVYFMLPAVALTVSFFFFVFPGSRLFSLALANSLAVYTCLFVSLAELNFSAHITFWEVYLGFAAPLVGLILGSWRKRDAVRRLVAGGGGENGAQHGYGRVLFWLSPLIAIGFVATLAQRMVLTPSSFDELFLGAMAVAGVLIFFVSHDILVFLLKTGLTFEAFFLRIRKLLGAAYTFTTFYTLLVIVFACIYRIVDRVSDGPRFLIRGEPSEITFIESLYFSIITLSTVGYGDIVPVTSGVQTIVAIQILLGVLLLLFGFNEIFRYAQSKEGEPDE